MSYVVAHVTNWKYEDYDITCSAFKISWYKASYTDYVKVLGGMNQALQFNMLVYVSNIPISIVRNKVFNVGTYLGKEKRKKIPLSLYTFTFLEFSMNHIYMLNF